LHFFLFVAANVVRKFFNISTINNNSIVTFIKSDEVHENSYLVDYQDKGEFV